MTSLYKKELIFPGLQELGSKGTAVQQIQEWLVFFQHPLKIDAEFGHDTESFVKLFQKKLIVVAIWPYHQDH